MWMSWRVNKVGRVGFCRWLIYLLCVIMLICCSVSAVMAENCSDEDEHLYKLFLRADGLGYYTCLCIVEGCNEHFDVYPQGYEVEMTKTEGDCTHVFRKGEQVKRVSVESASYYSHEAAQWFDCACEYCGEAFEAYVADGKLYSHRVSDWEGIHINGELKHLFVGHCDDCGQLRYEIVNCYQYENGTCMGGGEYLEPEPELER